MGRSPRQRVRRRNRQRESNDQRRFRPRRNFAPGGPCRCAHRQRLRRACLRRRRSCHARRHPHSAFARRDRAFGCRCRAACAGRRHSRRARRRRYRLAFSAERSAMEGRLVGSLPRLRLRARARAPRHDRPSRRDRRVRGAACLAASRRHARAHRRDRRHCSQPRRESKRRPAKSSALPAAAKASSRWRRRRSGCRGAPHDRRQRCAAPHGGVLDLCRARGLRIATAESCTGGLVAGGSDRNRRLLRCGRLRLCHLFE